jgi:hypothetical protein
MVFAILIIYVILLVKGNYPINQEAPAPSQGQRETALASAQIRCQTLGGLGTSESFWLTATSPFQRRTLPGQDRSRNGAISGGLAMFSLLEDEQGLHPEMCALWHQVDTWMRPYLHAPEGATRGTQESTSTPTSIFIELLWISL